MRTSEAVFWENCSKGNNVLQFKSVSLQPKDITLPGKITLSWTAEAKHHLRGLMAKVQFHKKMYFWMEIPCPHFFNCEFTFCDWLDREPSCSFTPNSSINATKSFDYTMTKGLSFLTSGSYSAKLTLLSNGKVVGCVRVYFEITAS
ncbi:ganglioside GM2 activator-like isoform X2 [Pristis pectinata]|uniref:ganglioside GM2 activator-like isoform X2 n=1 Tax=Pristis pectinata TaxID=685728 RepID=UPI00223E86AB|nr:ganglioside GM2 activator-like isoform X2 [Pristis pectinata]